MGFALNETRNKQNRKGQRGKENKNQLFEIDGGLLMFLPFFMVGVTYMRNDYHKKGQIVKMLPRDESF